MKTAEQQLIEEFDIKDYNSIEVGSYINIDDGKFYLKSKPNIHQPINLKYWEFIWIADSFGKPMILDIRIFIKC